MVDKLKFESTYIPHIRDQLSTGSLVLFTGAGFSLKAVNLLGETLPSAKKLTELIWNICFPGDDFEKDTNLQDIYEDAINRNSTALSKLLTSKFTVDVSKCPDFYRFILSMPWLRVYTLNIDDLMDKVVDNYLPSRGANVISAMSDNITMLSNDNLDIFHLNGNLDDIPYKVTFSRTQYAERIGQDPFYNQLAADLLTRSVIFIGSSLEEDTLWEHLNTRGVKGPRTASELRPRSYLVLPTLNKSRMSMLAKFNIVWLDMTCEQFCDQVLSSMDEAKSKGFGALLTKGLISSDSNKDIKLVSDIAQIDVEQTEYLLGEEPTWSDFKEGKIADRTYFSELWEEISRLRAKSEKSEFLIITGTAASGKSTALYWAALKLLSDGVHVGWLDANVNLSRGEFIKSLERNNDLGALLINDADIYGNVLSSMVRLANERIPKLLVILETRASKVDKIIKPNELGMLIPTELTIPNLTDYDIEKLIAVLDRENRLGKLKGEDHDSRILAFKRLANRQLLVAMYEATSGKKFSERAADELNELQGVSKLVYGLVSTASAYRFSLTRDEVLIACGEATNETLNSINALVRRKLIHTHSGNQYLRARHRVIADLIYNSLVQSGEFERIVRGLIMIGVAKVNQFSDKNTRPARILRTFINHHFMFRTVDREVARNIYGEFEDALNWSSHYWLHRGALELDMNDLGKAENFLNQAMSLGPSDLFIQNEWALLLFKKAICNPSDSNAPELIIEATRILESIIYRKADISAYAYHVLGSQGLRWADCGIVDEYEQKKFLLYLEEMNKDAIKIHSTDALLVDLDNQIKEAILRLAV